MAQFIILRQIDYELIVNYDNAPSNIILSPQTAVTETLWLATMPHGDALDAQGGVQLQLQKFLVEEHPLDRETLGVLRNIEVLCRPNVAKLTQKYLRATALPTTVDDRVWNSVCRYLTLLARVYQRFLFRCLQAPSSLPGELPQLILELMDCQYLLLKWRYFRHQDMEEGGWTRLHKLYRLAEKAGCHAWPLRRYRHQNETTIQASYLRALMLGILTPSAMQRHETEMVAGWIAECCATMAMTDTYEATRHLFYINLDEDRGGQHVRRFQPGEHFRYWDADELTGRISRACAEVRQGKVPAELTLVAGMHWQDSQPLLEYLLSAWSKTHYRRQRRAHGRNEVRRISPVGGGMEYACQHVRAMSYMHRKGKAEKSLTGTAPPLSTLAFFELGDGTAAPGMDAGRWEFINESPRGYGALVEAGPNQNLRLGRLVSFDNGQNLQHPLVGVVRNIKQMTEYGRHVGIEVLSRKPLRITLRNLDENMPAQNRDQIMLTAAPQGKAFSALYLPGDEASRVPPTLLVPAMEYIAAGAFELRTDPHVYRVRLGKVVEQRDDWVCVEARALQKDSGC